MNTDMYVAELPFRGQQYRVKKLNCFEQFHVGRRLAPVFAVAGVRGAFIVQQLIAQEKAKGSGELSQDDPRMLTAMLDLLQPMSEVLAKMTDEDCNYVLHTCLKATQRREADGRYQEMVAGGQMMYADVDIDVMMRLVIEVLRVNLGGFSRVLGGNTPSPSA